MTMIPVPENERSPLLKPLLRECVTATDLLLKNQHNLGIMPNDIFANAMGQWFLEDDLSEQQLNDVAGRKAQLSSVGFDGAYFRQKLEEVFYSDRHLARCCKTVWKLTTCISSLFLNFLGSNVPRETFEESFRLFSNYLYSNEYHFFIVHHLFNFDAEVDEFEIAGTFFKRFTTNDIAFVFENEVTFNLFHAENVGSYFAIREVVADENNDDEFLKSYKNAYESVGDTIGLLQFIKDGYFSSDYAFHSFQPPWINKLFPPLPSGHQRKAPYDEGRKFYHLTKEDINLAQKWSVIWYDPEIQSRLGRSTNLGNLVRLAIEFYSSSFDQPDEAQRLLHLTFALEALFSPDDKQELSFRIRQYASQFVGANAKERKEIFDSLKIVYDRRSKLVHGSLNVSDYIDDTLTTAGSNEELASIVRRSILGMLTLLFRGRDNLKGSPKGNKSDRIHRELELASLNRGIAYSLRSDSNPETFAKEFESL